MYAPKQRVVLHQHVIPMPCGGSQGFTAVHTAEGCWFNSVALTLVRRTLDLRGLSSLLRDSGLVAALASRFLRGVWSARVLVGLPFVPLARWFGQPTVARSVVFPLAFTLFRWKTVSLMVPTYSWHRYDLIGDSLLLLCRRPTDECGNVPSCVSLSKLTYVKRSVPLGGITYADR